MSHESQHTQRLDFAVDAARRAGELILRYYQNSDLAVEFKSDESPVTAADRGAEELLRELIADAFPDDAVLGEEFGEQTGTSGYRWILDPVDGTKSFVHGVPLFGTLIGLELGEECIAGVCRLPALDEVVYAGQGNGAWWQRGEAKPVPARVRTTPTLKEALFSYTAVELFDQHGRRPAFEALVSACSASRAWGDCYGHVLVATGRADVMADPVMNVWDAAPLLPILREAGGVFMDWAGRETIRGGNGISVTASLKDEVLALIRSTVRSQ
jgi:histidinol phosphatase-like enzyme (inositol monophosphatase family)